jgi:prophage antirepressor-like protein
MKAKNETAEKFQALVADDIIPSIRKHGMYAVDDLLNNPDLLIAMATRLKEEREENKRLLVENSIQAQQINELTPKATYYDRVALRYKEIISQKAKERQGTRNDLTSPSNDGEVKPPFYLSFMLYCN